MVQSEGEYITTATESKRPLEDSTERGTEGQRSGGYGVLRSWMCTYGDGELVGQWRPQPTAGMSVKGQEGGAEKYRTLAFDSREHRTLVHI